MAYLFLFYCCDRYHGQGNLLNLFPRVRVCDGRTEAWQAEPEGKR